MKRWQNSNNNRLAIHHSLGARFSLHIFLILIIVNFFSLLFIYNVAGKNHVQDLRDQAGVIGSYIASSVSPHLLKYDFVALDATLQEAMRLKEIHYTAIIAFNEVYVAARVAPPCLKSQNPNASDATMPDRLKIVTSLRDKALKHIDISTPILFGDNYLGRVVVGLSTNISKQKTKNFLTILLVVNAVVSLFLAVGIYLFFWKDILQPIYRLIEGADRITLGNYNEAVTSAGSDEIGLLTDSFNTMMLARKQAEEDTLRSRKDWERLFNSVDDVVTILDNDMRVLQANDATGKLLGKDPEELIGMHCYEIFRGNTKTCEDCPTVQCASDHQRHHGDIQHLNLGKTFHISAFPIYDEKLGWVGIAHIARDITTQIKLEAQYRQSQKMEAIGTLAGGIAHDFNNILTPIIGYAQLIKLDAEPKSQTASYIDRVLHSSGLARQLVKQILTFSREREHKMDVIQIQPIIKESMKLLRASIPTTIEFKLSIDKNCGNIVADPTQIHQIIMNLCTNAYHAMETSGGTLEISLNQITMDELAVKLKSNLAPGNYLRLKISDTGSGMSADVKERIFEPFFTTKKEGKGTGMGLSVVHGIIKKYGGEINVYSEPDQGTTFTMYLPSISLDLSSDTGGIKTGDKHSFPKGNEHILVVDDEQSIANLEQQILESVGYTITQFTDSEQAMKTFQESPDKFDLVITDMTMPKLTGQQLAEQIIAIRPNTPIILCTGLSYTSIEEMLNGPTFTNYLAKPVDILGLTTTVRKSLDMGKQR